MNRSTPAVVSSGDVTGQGRKNYGTKSIIYLLANDEDTSLKQNKNYQSGVGSSINAHEGEEDDIDDSNDYEKDL